MSQRDEFAEIQELLDEVCGPRAAMFVGSRSFLDVATYVNGYLGGRCYGNGMNLTQYIRLFGIWLATRHSKPRNIGWGRIVLEVCDQVNELALEHAPRLFNEFCIECGEFDKKRWFEEFGPFMQPWSEQPRTAPRFSPSSE